MNNSLRNKISSLSKSTLRTMRRVILLISGSTLILLGTLMLVLPGPGTLVIFLGLTLLAVEFVWARILIKRAKNTVLDLQKGAKQLLKGKNSKQ